MPKISQQDNREAIQEAVNEQVLDQQGLSARQLDVAVLFAIATDVKDALTPFPAAAAFKTSVDVQIAVIKSVQQGKEPYAALGDVLIAFYELRADVARQAQAWLAAQPPQAAPRDTLAFDTAVLRAISQTRQLLSARPDVAAVMDDLTAIKNLAGGPADATAFHDFFVLQIAFENVWLHAFDNNLKSAVEQLYEKVVGAAETYPAAFPGPDALEDVNQLQDFITGVKAGLGQPTDDSIPAEVISAFPGWSAQWHLLSDGQKSWVHFLALTVVSPDASPDAIQQARDWATAMYKAPDGPGDRLSSLIYKISLALNEPYHFDVFAPDTYNFGLMVTYRQKWEPGPYQAGDLVATIPLAPSETRKFTKKRVVKETVARKVAEKSTATQSRQTSETGRAESEIMNKATTATNFKMTSHGSFNIGIGSFDVTNEFGGNTDLQSTTNKKAFHEATLKAAEEYRLERSMEVDTTRTTETEETESGEISNPNNEITVTYLFYELQRRFTVSEYLYRVQPVILVAQDVPAPHEIDEAWLVQYQWILARVLLDDSFRPALTYLTSGFAGDEVSLDVIKASWEKQRDLVQQLEAQTNLQLSIRDSLRDLIIQQTLNKDKLDNPVAGALAFVKATTDQLAKGDWRLQPADPSTWSADDIEANRKAAQSRLEYVEQALGDAQDKLKQASSAFEAATKAYSAAMQNRYTRHLTIDQLRVHVKQNILYYMQAIWAHEPTDQRYFRLYKKTVICPEVAAGCTPVYTALRRGVGKWGLDVTNICVPGLGSGVGGHDHELHEVADLDNPLGYKGNYMIFPLIDSCPLTDYMLANFVDTELGVYDKDLSDRFDPETFEQQWQGAVNNPTARDTLKKQLQDYILSIRRGTDEIIVPTGQLFIEALPGAHALLEDFKLEHRLLDVLRAKADVRHAGLENLRLASRLVEGQTKTKLLEDPDIEKKVIFEGGHAPQPSEPSG